MSKPKAPAAPDPTATIAAQDASNSKAALQTAELNRIDQNTPYGSLSYSIGGYNQDGTPQYTQNETFSPSQQNLFDMSQQGAQSLGQSALGLLGNVQSTYGTPIDYSGAPGIASGPVGNIGQVQNFGNVNAPNLTGSIGYNGPGPAFGVGSQANFGPAIQQAENAAYRGQTQYLDPQFSQKHEALDNSLINQGITQGSQAANTAQQNLGLQENQAYGNAGLQAVQAGQQEQNTLFGQGLSSADLFNQAQGQAYGQQANDASFQNSAANQGFSNVLALNQARNQAQAQQYAQGLSTAQQQNQAQAQYLQQLFAQRNQPLNEYNALATGAQVQQPNFNQFAQSPVGATQSGQIINQGYQNQLGAYQQQMAGINNLFSLGGSLGAAAILAP